MSAFALSQAPPRPAGLVTTRAERIYLHPGQLAVAQSEGTLSTILGSCVAVCLHDPELELGGLNHFLLPRAPEHDHSTRYGDAATRRLLREMLRRGALFSRLNATVIGGACVLDAYRDRKADLGRSNVRAALDTLAAAGITAVRQDVEGSRGRRVTFDPRTGDVAVRLL